MHGPESMRDQAAADAVPPRRFKGGESVVSYRGPAAYYWYHRFACASIDELVRKK